jgi:hypothetical protein
MMTITFTAVLLLLGVPGGWTGRPGVGFTTGALAAAGGPVTAAPHFSQNLVPSASEDPQLAQNMAIYFPPGDAAQIFHATKLLRNKRRWKSDDNETRRANRKIAVSYEAFDSRSSG